MTVLNASAATEAVNILPGGDQISYRSRDSGGYNSPMMFSWLTTGGDDIQVFGSLIDHTGDKPTSGLVYRVQIDLSNNDEPRPDVVITEITSSSLQGLALLPRLASGSGGFHSEFFSGDDRMTGGIHDDTFKAGGGADTLRMGAGDDTAWGGAGNDYLDGGVGNDDLRGEAGDDKLHGDVGHDTISGGAGNDGLYGGIGDDGLHGGAGRDWLNGGVSADTLYAGAGSDTLGGGEGDDYLGGEAGDDWLYGEAGYDYLAGGDGHDRLEGGDGHDTLNGGAGNDTLHGAAGVEDRWVPAPASDGLTDVLQGGAGDDYYKVDIHDFIEESMDGGIDTVELSSYSMSDSGITEYRLHGAVDNLTVVGAGDFGVTVFGNALSNIMEFESPVTEFTVFAGSGDDQIVWGSLLHGYADGGEGDDTFTFRGETSATVRGGPGADRFVLTREDTRVEILDFDGAGAAAGDLIHLDLGGPLTFVGATAPADPAGEVWLEEAGNGDTLVRVENLRIRIVDGAVSASDYTADDFILG